MRNGYKAVTEDFLFNHAIRKSRVFFLEVVIVCKKSVNNFRSITIFVARSNIIVTNAKLPVIGTIAEHNARHFQSVDDLDAVREEVTILARGLITLCIIQRLVIKARVMRHDCRHAPIAADAAEDALDRTESLEDAITVRNILPILRDFVGKKGS